MVDLPSGTVTFLFTDIEGSTPLWEQHRQAMRVAVARHHTILREAIEENHGHVFNIAGDAFCAAFATANEALAAALAAQWALSQADWGQTPIRVRMGVHTGEAEAAEGDYRSGPTLNRVARVMSIAYGGQILLSQITAGLVRRQLPDGISLRDMGEHRLKGLADLERILQVVAPDLRTDFPPLKSLSTVPNNLPVQLTSFIGREREMAEVKRLLTTTRLLTLTGSGGTGKTRLSLQVATDLLDRYPDGVWFVELAPLTDPALVPQTVASVMGVREEPGRPILATLTDHLREKHLLMVLDNCEHLIEACARLADTLLHAAPDLKILASSREALAIAGETTFHVPSLPSPDPRASIPASDLRHYAAVELFVERAEAAKSSFALSHANAPAVAQICHRLDGIPLAIELAAARIKVFTPEQIAARLDDRFRLLTGGSRTALPRQQTLRGAIDWSYGLLSDPERILLRRLSVFAGGWTFEAAEAVCSGNGIEGADVLDLLTHLVDKSLVVLDEQSAEPRYRMLETVRQYAREKLLDAGEVETIRTRHLELCKLLAEVYVKNMYGPDQVAWVSRMETELDNIRVALQWSLECLDSESGMRLASGLRTIWYQKHPGEGLEHISALLALPVAASRSGARAHALFCQGFLAKSNRDYLSARHALEEALTLSKESGDNPLFSEVLGELGQVAYAQGDARAARLLLSEALGKSRQAGRQGITGDILFHLGAIALSQNELSDAQSLFEESIRVLTPLGERHVRAQPLRFLGQVAQRRGEYPQAGTFIRESLTLNVQGGDRRGVAACLAAWAALLAAEGQLLSAVRLSGAVETLLDSIHARLMIYDQEQYDDHLKALRAALSPAAFDAAFAAGRALTMEQAVAYTLNDTGSA